MPWWTLNSHLGSQSRYQLLSFGCVQYVREHGNILEEFILIWISNFCMWKGSGRAEFPGKVGFHRKEAEVLIYMLFDKHNYAKACICKIQIQLQLNSVFKPEIAGINPSTFPWVGEELQIEQSVKQTRPSDVSRFYQNKSLRKDASWVLLAQVKG